MRAATLARALIMGGNWLKGSLAHTAEPGRVQAAVFGRALCAQPDAHGCHQHCGQLWHRGWCLFPPQSRVMWVQCAWQRWQEPCPLTASLAAQCVGCPAPDGALPCGWGCSVLPWLWVPCPCRVLLPPLLTCLSPYGVLCGPGCPHRSCLHLAEHFAGAGCSPGCPPGKRLCDGLPGAAAFPHWFLS